MSKEKSLEETSSATAMIPLTESESQNPTNFCIKEDSNDFVKLKNTNIREFPVNVIQRSITDPLTYQNLAPSYYSDNDAEEFNDQLTKCSNISVKSISSCFNIPISEQFERNVKMHTENEDSYLIRRRYSSLVTPTYTKKKMPLKKIHPMSLGGKIGQNHIQNVNMNGQQIQVGLGFPTKTPIIKNETAEIIENSDKDFDNLEHLIQNIKNNKDPSKISLIQEVKSISTKINNFNISLNEKDKFDVDNDAFSQATNDFDYTKNEYIEMETSLLNEFTDIKTSINKILEDRRLLQTQHRIWLQTMKKKIYQTKERTRNIEILHQT